MATTCNNSSVYHRFNGLLNEESPDSWFSNDVGNDRFVDYRFIINLINEVSDSMLIISPLTRSIS